MIRRQNFAFTLVLVLALSCLAAVAAQEKSAGKSKPEETPSFPQAKPGPEMRKLNFQLGAWKTQEKHEAVPGFAGGEGKGVLTAKLGPGDLSVVTDYKSTGIMGSYVGKGIVVWDAEEQAYKLYWFDNFAAGSMNMTGKWEGSDLVFTGDSKMMGQKYSMKEVFTDITPNSYTMKMFMSEGGPLVLAFTLKATKQ